MEDGSIDIQNLDSRNAAPSKKKLGLPIAAFLLNVIPFLCFIGNPDVILLFLISIFPFAGFI